LAVAAKDTRPRASNPACRGIHASGATLGPPLPFPGCRFAHTPHGFSIGGPCCICWWRPFIHTSRAHRSAPASPAGRAWGIVPTRAHGPPSIPCRVSAPSHILTQQPAARRVPVSHPTRAVPHRRGRAPTGLSGCCDSRYSSCAIMTLLVLSSMGPFTHMILSRSSRE
jgi:hypothetical protein